MGHWVAAPFALLGTCLAGCGASSSSAPHHVPDTTPPAVILTQPGVSATYVSRGANIAAIFDDFPDPVSVTASNFMVRDAVGQPVSGTLSFSGLRTCFSIPPPNCGYGITFNPHTDLAYGEQYSVVVRGIRNSDGYVMASDFTWSFTVLPVGTGTWQDSATVNAPSPRFLHTAVWTGNEMIVWGGGEKNSSSNTGGRYDPANDSWQPITVLNAPGARSNHTAIWTGSEMIVWGGTAGAGNGGRYSPAGDSWSALATANSPPMTQLHTAVWTGDRMIVWGGDPYRNNGGIYDPVSDGWQATSLVNAPLGRSMHSAVWTGTEMIVWGGTTSTGGMSGRTNSGGRYNPATDTWTAMSTSGAPEPREHHAAVWTGTRMIVWGGFGTELLNTGGIYDPATDTWEATQVADAPPRRSNHTAIWSGSHMIVWGGSGSSTGARFDPLASAWTATSNIDVPEGRESHTAVWTGTQMIVWGGRILLGINTGTSSGGRYSP